MNMVIRNRVDDLGSLAKAQKNKVQTSMQINPMKWAGIAAGVGFGLGLIGRLLQRRVNRNLPELIVIETV